MWAVVARIQEPMSLNRFAFFKLAAAGAVAVGAFFAVASANAGTNWSVGINVPGVEGGVVAPGPVYYEPPPVYYQPAPPVYYRPPPPVYYRPPPVYYRPAPVYYGPPAFYESGDRWRDRHHRRDGDDRD